jgi:hypothetical protein
MLQRHSQMWEDVEWLTAPQKSAIRDKDPSSSSTLQSTFFISPIMFSLYLKDLVHS